MTEEEKQDKGTIQLPGEKPISLGLDYSEEYFPMDDYPARGYQPMGGRKEHFCEACIGYYKRLNEKGLTKKPFMPVCCGDIRRETNSVDLSVLGDDADYYRVLQDPVAWASFEFNWTARWYQQEILRCTSQFKAVRAGRRVGKTEVMALSTLWHAYLNGQMDRGQFEILVIAPYQTQVTRVFDIMRRLIGESRSLSLPGVITRNRLNPQHIEFSSGGIIRGFSSGSHSASKSDKIRGQDAHMLVMDEVDYLADEDIEVIMAVLASHPECKLLVSSTPTGLRQKLHSWCTQKNLGFKEFWYISMESPSWTNMVEDIFRTQYSDSGFSREFYAEFGETGAGVFRTEDIHAAICDYKYEDCVPHNGECKYVIGVDWNQSTGTHITVVEALQMEGGFFKFRLVLKEIIRKAEFTQHAAVERLVELDKIWGNRKGYIYVDAGFGTVQCEIMWKMDVDYPHEEYKFRDRVVPITMNQNIEIRDPASGKMINKQCKHFMVDNAARVIERRQVMVPVDEDTTARIIEEELPFLNIGLIQQMRDFKIEKVSPTGVPRYSQGYEHTLTAWMLAIMGHTLQFSDICKTTYTTQVAYTKSFNKNPSKKDTIRDLSPINSKSEAVNKTKEMQQKLKPEKRNPTPSPIAQIRRSNKSTGPMPRTSSPDKSRHWEEEIGSEKRKGYIHRGTRRGI